MSKVSEAYSRSSKGRDALIDVGACAIECTEDTCGIVWERWLLPNGTCVILHATPHSWNVFVPCTNENFIAATIDAIKVAAGAQPAAA